MCRRFILSDALVEYVELYFLSMFGYSFDYNPKWVVCQYWQLVFQKWQKFGITNIAKQFGNFFGKQ